VGRRSEASVLDRHHGSQTVRIQSRDGRERVDAAAAQTRMRRPDHNQRNATAGHGLCQHGFSFVSWSDKRVIPANVDPEADMAHNRFNDGKCDPSGRLIAGTMHVDAGDTTTGSLYSLSGDLTVKRLLGNIGISNGIVWTRRGDIMYYIDSNQYNVVAFDYNTIDGTISNKREVFKVDPAWGKPDGMTIDSNDDLWICAWNGNKVVHYDPRLQKVLLTIHIPSRYVTSCAFAGPHLADLYVTTASAGEGWPPDYQLEPLAGSLFVVKGLGVRGVPSVAFAGPISSA